LMGVIRYAAYFYIEPIALADRWEMRKWAREKADSLLHSWVVPLRWGKTEKRSREMTIRSCSFRLTWWYMPVIQHSES
jgi:hypothetical protein